MRCHIDLAVDHGLGGEVSDCGQRVARLDLAGAVEQLHAYRVEGIQTVAADEPQKSIGVAVRRNRRRVRADIVLGSGWGARQFGTRRNRRTSNPLGKIG